MEKELNKWRSSDSDMNTAENGVVIFEMGEVIKPVFISERLKKMNMEGENEENSSKPNKTDYILESIHHDDISYVAACLRKCATEGFPMEGVYRLRNGKWHSGQIINLKVKSGENSKVLAIVSEAGEGEEAQLRRKLIDKKNEFAVDTKRLCTFEVDLEKDRLYLSEAFQNRYKWKKTTVENLPEGLIDLGVLTKESDDLFREAYNQLKEGKGKGYILLKGKYYESASGEYLKCSWRLVFGNGGLAVKANGVIEPVIDCGLSNDLQIKKIAELQSKLAISESYSKRLKESQKGFRKYRHDIKNNIIALRGLLKQGDVSGALEYLSGMAMDIKRSTHFIDTGNPAVDAMISEKLEVAGRRNIKCFHIVSISPNVEIKPKDFSLIVGSCLDNAIDACSRIESEGLEKIIDFQLVEKRGAIIFKMKNTAIGEPRVYHNVEELISKKKDNECHGFGMLTVRDIVRKYRGHLRIEQRENEFLTEFLLFTDSIGDDA